MRCIVSTCEQDIRAEDSDLVVHRIPKKEPRRQQWIDAVIEGVRRSGGLQYDVDRVQEHLRVKDPRICSAHFLPEQYNVENENRWLKKDAYPIIFPPDVAPPLPKTNKCALKFCSNVLSLLDHPSNALSGHRIPKNEPRRSRWIRAIMAGLQTCGHEFDRRMLSNSSARICSAHFLPEQYTGRDGGPRLLERDAVPCVFKLEAPLPFDTGARTTAVIRKFSR
ncbi:predicted protein [Culex quinquefasciatus]|uniref:Predicted protein n=1 Tax=Culex quinquefasciatus TaxID=7176 RepID=B0W0X8_CULQU|nr:uncharacterized protein LOC120415930 [Culex pipiens pallens]EDS42795.1 predicted protein [Culex quinquefasciatus]|eukprot:XP_001842362.1 predicted protein [Culex quinquefasciatus]